MIAVAKGLMTLGAVLFLLGSAVLVADRLGLPLGRLPGDVFYRGRHGSVYFPIVTCLVISILLSLILSLWAKGRP